jgi:hypothetical protein
VPVTGSPGMSSGLRPATGASGDMARRVLKKPSAATMFSGGGVFRLSRLLKGLAAGYGASKLGGGCLTTILVFIILYWLFGILF